MTTKAHLAERGDRLERAFAEDLRTEKRKSVRAQRSWLSTRRARWLGACVGAAIIAPGVAYAAGAFTSPQSVAASMPRAAVIFGAHPTCVTVAPNVEYRCTLAEAPAPDPVHGLTAGQWRKLLAAPPGESKLPTVKKRLFVGPGHYKLISVPKNTSKLAQLNEAYRDKTLASFGYTQAQIAAHDQAVNAGAAGIGAGQFEGTVEPIVDVTHHIDGGCRAINPAGTQWDCYLGNAAVAHKVVSGLGGYVPGPGVG